MARGGREGAAPKDDEVELHWPARRYAPMAMGAYGARIVFGPTLEAYFKMQVFADIRSKHAFPAWPVALCVVRVPIMDYTLPCRSSFAPRSAVPARQPSHEHRAPPRPHGRVLNAAPKISGELAPLEAIGWDTAGAQGFRWLPAVRSSPHVCVLGVQSPNLLTPGSFGRATAELQALWALAHGMEYRLVTCDLTGGRGMKHWNKPRALLAVLGGVSRATAGRPLRANNRTLAGDGAALQQAPACDWVFMIDADAAVRNLSVGLEHLLAGHTSGDGPSLSIACVPSDGIPARNSSCAINSGVVLARGDAHARQMLEFWASAGHGSCPAATQFAEQDCAQRMVDRWKARVRLHTATQLNAPLWLSPHIDVINHRREKGRFVVCGTKQAPRGAPSRWRPLSYDEWGAACFDHPTTFICHGIGFISIPLGNLTFHRAHLAHTVTRVLDAQRPELRRMLAARGEPAARIPAVAAEIDQAMIGGGHCADVYRAGPRANKEGISLSVRSDI